MDEIQQMLFEDPTPTTARQKGFWAWWYRVTTPPTPPEDASFEEREIHRRIRLTSIVIFVLIFVWLLSIPNALLGTNFLLLPLLGVLFITTLIGAILNKQGKVNLAGIIIVLSWTFIGIFGNIWTTAGGISPYSIPLFALLAMPEMFAAAMLPSWWVAGDAAVNIVGCILSVILMPHTADLNVRRGILWTYGVGMPIVLQVTIAGIAILWTTSILNTIRERNEAEEVAKLERDIAEQMTVSVTEKEALERSIAAIVQTQSRVANGDFSARVPLTNDNVLWPVAGTLNNLIGRLQKALESEQKLRITEQAAAYLLSQLQRQKQGLPPSYTRTNTTIDPIAMSVLNQTTMRNPQSGQTSFPEQTALPKQMPNQFPPTNNPSSINY